MCNFSFSKNASYKEFSNNLEFQKLLEKGHPVVYYIDKQKNLIREDEIYFKLYVIQYKEAPYAEDLKLFGFDGKTFYRCCIKISDVKANPKKADLCRVGKVLEGWDIIQTDSLLKTSDSQKPKTTVLGENGITEEYILTKDNNFIYKELELVPTIFEKKSIFIKSNGRVKIDYLVNHQNLKSNIPFENLPLWFRRASTKNAIIFCNNNKIIWENGIWILGEWENGIWQNGDWEDGIWLDGIWLSGTWKNGEWIKGLWLDGFWENGHWKDGFWKNGHWKNGFWWNGTWNEGWWHKGTWENGIWENGTFFGGKWIGGTWKNGDDCREEMMEIFEELIEKKYNQIEDDIYLHINQKTKGDLKTSDTSSQNYGEATDFI